MTLAITPLWTSPLIEQLGWTLLHFLWEGAAVAALLWIALLALGRASARARYGVSIGALALMMVLPALTFPQFKAHSPATSMPAAQVASNTLAGPMNSVHSPASNSPGSADMPPTLSLQRADAPAGRAESAIPMLHELLPWLVAVWALGVCMMGLWHLGGWWAVERLKKLGTRPVDAAMQEMFETLRRQLRISRPVRLLQTAILETPVVIGWLLPVVLMPTAILAGLSPAQLEAILAHELAHIRRHDYLVNLLQTLAETLLFYHPGVWWVTRQIRQEREHCCDDLAAGLSGNRVAYAQTLLRIEELCRRAPKPALGATGGELLPRIRRLLGKTGRPFSVTQRSVAAVGLALILVLAPFLLQRAGVWGQSAPAIPGMARTLAAPRGTVKDAAGKPIAGAKVGLYYGDSNWGLDDRVVETVTSDAQGNFQFTKSRAFKALDARNGDQYVLLALHPDYALGWETIRAANTKAQFDLLVTTPRTQTVHLIDDQGSAVAGARVSVSSAGGSDKGIPQLRNSFFLYSDPRLISALTDEQGNATLPNLPAAPVQYRISAAGHGSVQIRDENAGPVTMQLSRAATVEGQVVDPQGRGVADALVSFEVARDVSLGVVTRTDATGHFRQELIAKGGLVFNDVRVSGEYRVTLSHASLTAKMTSLALTPGQTISDLTIRAVPGTVISGRLLERGSGKPVANAGVTADTPAGRLHARTGADGRFSWRVAGPGTVTAYFESPPEGLFVRSDPRNPPSSARLTLDGSETVAELSLDTPGPLDNKTSLAGRILMPDGTPADGLRVEAHAAPGGPGYYGRVESDAGGAFLLPGVPASATLNLYVQNGDRSLAAVADVTTPERAQPDPLDLQLRRTQSADVLITDAQGHPLPNTRVNVIPSFDQFTPDVPHQADTDASGRLKVDGIVPGNQYQVRLAHRVPGADKVLEDSCVYLTLLPREGESPKVIILSNLLPIRVVDAAGKQVPIEDTQTLEVEIAPRSVWQMGPKPEIKGRLDDGSVLIARDQIILAHDKNPITFTFQTSGGVVVRARGPLPDNTSRLDLTLLARIEAAGVLQGGPGLPTDIAADELAGRIVDSAGKPIAGARISFPDNRAGVPDRIAAVTADAQGLFRVPHLQRFLYVQVDASGFARRWLTGLLPGKGVTITLDNTTHFRGTVRLPDGKPAAGTEIMLETSRLRPDDPDSPIPNLQLTLKADEQGAFDVLVEPGEYECFATGSGGLFARIPHLQVKAGQQLDQAVTLAPGVHLKVKAVNSLTGQPLAGVKFYIWKKLPYVTEVAPGSERTTNANGIAEWESVMPGLQAIDQLSPQYGRWTSPVRLYEWSKGEMNNQAVWLDLKPGMDEVVVRMEPAMHVTGKVLDPRGQPVAKVWVNVEGFETGDRRYMRSTNAQGEFDLYVPAKYYDSDMYHMVVARDGSYRTPDAVGGEFAPKPGGEKSFVLTLPDAPASAPGK